ncbi:MAG: hypothetical protein J0M08_02020 [Bacteroidetes bacterium]|nr:hypothetical protein [Bacteroidota bacterium]
MRKFIFLLIVLVCNSLFAQDSIYKARQEQLIKEVKEMKMDMESLHITINTSGEYLQKTRKQFFIGLAMSAGSILSFSVGAVSQENSFYFIGGAMSLASFGLFTASYLNIGKAGDNLVLEDELSE